MREVTQLNLLIVHPSAETASEIVRLLTADGHKIEARHLETAAEYSDAIDTGVSDCIIVGQEVAGLDLVHAYLELRQAGQDAPFVVVADEESPELLDRLLRVGVDGYLSRKSFSLLPGVVERGLRRADLNVARQRAERALRESEERFRLLAETASNAIVTIDTRSRMLFINAATEQIFGYARGEMLGEPLTMLLPDDVGRRLTLGIREYLETGRNKNAWSGIDVPARHKSGSEIFVNISFADYMQNGERLFTGIISDITNRIRAERAIRQSEENFRALVQATSQFVWTAEADGASPELFKWFSELTGRDVQSVDDIRAAMHPDDLVSASAGWTSSLDEGKLFEYTCRFMTRDGSYRYYNARSIPVFDKDGSFRCWIGTFTDIHEQQQAQERLRQSEARYRYLFENNPYPMWVYDTETLRFLAVNYAATVEYGYSEEEFLAMDILQIRPPEDADAVRLKAAATSRRIDTSGAWRHLRKNGSTMRVAVTSHSIKFNDRPARLVLANDITDRLAAEESLRLSEEKYRELIENANDIIYTHDLEGNFLSLNHAGERVLGYAAAEAAAMNITDVIVPDHLATARRMLEQKINSGPATTYEIDVIAKDGRTVSLEVNSRVIAHNGKPVAIQGIARDVTERREAGEALRRSEVQLIQSQKLESIGTLAGGISHDFNNMLTAINGYSELLLRRIPKGDPLRRSVEEIHKAGERSAALTRQLLAFSRRQILLPKLLNINEVITDTTTMLERLIGENISISANLAEDLGKTEIDPGQLAQILTNLVVNARDAMPDGGSIIIETSNIYLDEPYASRHIGARPGEYVMLAVSDTGVGMDEATAKRIFEPFFTTKEVGKGTGLGLATVYGVVKQSGGNIWVYSEPGNGTTFKIYFPSVRDQCAGDAETAAALETGRGGHETILLVEDEEIVRTLSREILESYGYEIIEARSGGEAVDILSNAKVAVDLLVTDIVMPGMGGRALAETAWQTRPGLRVLFTSGYTDDAIMRHGFIDEGTNFIQKPFTSDTLSRKVRNLLDS